MGVFWVGFLGGFFVWVFRVGFLMPTLTWPQSCSVSDVSEFSWSTRTTPKLNPAMLSTPRPVALTPSRPGRRRLTVRPSALAAQGQTASARRPLA